MRWRGAFSALSLDFFLASAPGDTIEAHQYLATPFQNPDPAKLLVSNKEKNSENEIYERKSIDKSNMIYKYIMYKDIYFNHISKLYMWILCIV